MLKTYILASLVIVNISSTSNAITDSELGATTFTSGLIGAWLGAAIAKKNNCRLDDPSANLLVVTCSVAAATLACWSLIGRTPKGRLDQAKKINDSVVNQEKVRLSLNKAEHYNEWIKTCFKKHPQFRVLAVMELEEINANLGKSKALLTKAYRDASGLSDIKEKIEIEQIKRKDLSTTVKRKINFLKTPQDQYLEQLRAYKPQPKIHFLGGLLQRRQAIKSPSM